MSTVLGAGAASAQPFAAVQHHVATNFSKMLVRGLPAWGGVKAAPSKACPKASARLDLEVWAAGWAIPSSRGLCGGDVCSPQRNLDENPNRRKQQSRHAGAWLPRPTEDAGGGGFESVHEAVCDGFAGFEPRAQELHWGLSGGGAGMGAGGGGLQYPTHLDDPVMRRIWNHQNPEDCGSKKFLIWPFPGAASTRNVGSIMTNAVRWFATAMVTVRP